MLLGWGLSDRGQQREANEDHWLVDLDLGLLLVCDGMGGHVGGATASHLAAQAFHEAVELRARAGGLRGREVRRVVGEAAEAASLAVYDRAEDEPSLAGMGTTLTAAIIVGNRAYVAHVGDSRAYLVRQGVVRQLTEDHSLVQEQVRAGLLTEREARHSRFRNVITRSVGYNREVEVDLMSLSVYPGDIFLLCSDGLTGHVDDETMADILVSAFLGKAAQLLVDLANYMGGDDNITVVVGRIC